MATSGELAQIIAYALELPPETVAVHLRNIRLAGLISRKGHGRGAAKMTPLDATRLLLAASGSILSKDSVRSAKEFGQLKPIRLSKDRSTIAVSPGSNGSNSLEAEIAAAIDLIGKKNRALSSRQTIDWVDYLTGIGGSGPTLKLYLVGPQSSCDTQELASFSRAGPSDWNSYKSPDRVEMYELLRSDAARGLGETVLSHFENALLASRRWVSPPMTREHTIHPETLAVIALLLNEDRALDRLGELAKFQTEMSERRRQTIDEARAAIGRLLGTKRLK